MGYCLQICVGQIPTQIEMHSHFENKYGLVLPEYSEAFVVTPFGSVFALLELIFFMFLNGVHMSAFQNGKWKIQSVLVNDQTVLNNEGFISLDVLGDELVINPIGFRFQIQKRTPSGLLLESSGRVFYADVLVDNRVLELKLTRPDFDETIQIGAEYIASAVPSGAISASV